MTAGIAARWPRHQWDERGRSRWRTWGVRQFSFFAVVSSLIGLIPLEMRLWGSKLTEAPFLVLSLEAGCVRSRARRRWPSPPCASLLRCFSSLFLSVSSGFPAPPARPGDPGGTRLVHASV